MTLSDPAVSRFIQEKFVPCWESIRPVPKVTIDFGDGRVLHRTLGGNTVMYLCLPDGRPVDAYPGVYTGAALLQEMRGTLDLLAKLAPGNECGLAPAEEVRRWHQERVSESITSERRRITFSKAFVESPLLNALGVSRFPAAKKGLPNLGAKAAEEPELPLVQALGEKVTVSDPGAVLERLSTRIEELSKQPATVERLRAENAEVPEEKRRSPEELGRQAVEWDTATNLRTVRPAVHLLFSTFTDLPDARSCRDIVYRKILHVPVDDPNLGLADGKCSGGIAT